MARIEIKNAASLATCLGADAAAAVLGLRRPGWQRLPKAVTFAKTKPAFFLNDGDTLETHAIDLRGEAGRVSDGVYLGCGDTAANDRAQHAEGYAPPAGTAVLFIESIYNGSGNRLWYLTVVSPSLADQIER